MSVKDLCGWAGPELAIEAWQNEGIRAATVQYPRGEVREYKRFAPWDAAVRIATGRRFLPHYPQEIGDCVSFGGMNALENLQCLQIALLGEPDRFAYVFTPYLYGASRLAPEAGNGRLGNSDGSLGSWLAVALRKYGVLFFADDESLEYTGGIAKQWGGRGSPWENYTSDAADNLVKSVAPINTGAETRDALCNGSMLTIASNRGYSMRLVDRHGKSWFTGRDSWAHQMAVIAYAPAGDTGPHEEAVLIQNSWPETAHGPQIDGPPGSGWTTLKDFEDTLHSNGAECFALSGFEGFPANELDHIFFDRGMV